MEGMQACSFATGVDTQKPMRTATSVALTTQPRPFAPCDSHCVVISTCMRFRPYPVYRFCALPELRSNWMISRLIKPLSLMNEPVEGELELILERQAGSACQ